MHVQPWIGNPKRGKIAMGVKRMPVQKLPAKLKAIREALGLTQLELIDRLSVYDKRIKKKLTKSNISNFETGYREPAIPVLLAYARLSGVCMEMLADPAKQLPEKLPVEPGHRAED
jgi:transcriptional regulator with XRE-family HTH domain